MSIQANIPQSKPAGGTAAYNEGTAGRRSIYFIGIGGIGMSAIARYYHAQGYAVAGYDKTETPLTSTLQQMGMQIHFVEDVNMLPKDVELVVYTPAVPATHKELVYYLNAGKQVVKRSDVLKLITENAYNICVAGTHGKTTVSTMIAHLLRDTGYGCNAFLGGISANYNTNFWSDKNNVCVVEADEYDRSFLKLSPNIAVVTAMDADHLDIYGTVAELENAFVEFTQKVKPGGWLITKYGLNKSDELKAEQTLTYSLNDTAADVYTSNITTQHGSYTFDVMAKDWQMKNVVLNMGGLHNIENMVAALTVANLLNIDREKLHSAVATFAGVRRRFEYRIKTDEQVLIDDYAHHPQELKALISGVRSLFKQRLVVVFQPHLFSRTRDLAIEFAEALDAADEVLLLPVYPAREEPMAGVTSELILNAMRLSAKQIISKEDLLTWVNKNKPGLLVMAGAGDIDALVEPVQQTLITKREA